jgi:WD40 repeat protein
VSVRRYGENARKAETFIDLWDTIASTERRRRIQGDWTNLWDLAFSPDGKILATAARDTKVHRGNTSIGSDQSSTRIRDITSGRERNIFPVDRLH